MEPEKSGIVTAVSLLMRAEIIPYGNGVLRGELHSRYLEEPYVFFDLADMIFKMEEVFDVVGFPQTFLSPRSFRGGKRAVRRSKTEGVCSMEQLNSDALKTSKCTFEVTVRFRQNATWQGQIVWAEKNLKQNFRSVLEMLKLMDEALSEGDERAQPVDWEM